MTRLESKLITKSFNLIDLPDSRFKHFSFLCRRNRIISIGWNSRKSHTKAELHGYFFESMHSELHCILNAKNTIDNLSDLTLYNVRINNWNEVCMSRPCVICQKLMFVFNISKCKYTNTKGIFECYTN